MARNVRRLRATTSKGKADTRLDVFINCPFDSEYKPIFYAIVYTVVRSGYRARCAMETDNAGQNRLSKIVQIIGECPYGIHDISRTQTSGEPPLPRFNMPLELGLWLGAYYLGRDDQVSKQCIVFDSEPHRFQRFISDIGGQDIHAHSCSVLKVITEVAGWLRQLPGGVSAGGGQSIGREYDAFEAVLPAMCAGVGLTPEEMQFGDFNSMVTEYVANLTREPTITSDAEEGEHMTT